MPVLVKFRFNGPPLNWRGVISVGIKVLGAFVVLFVDSFLCPFVPSFHAAPGMEAGGREDMALHPLTARESSTTSRRRVTPEAVRA